VTDPHGAERFSSLGNGVCWSHCETDLRPFVGLAAHIRYPTPTSVTGRLGQGFLSRQKTDPHPRRRTFNTQTYTTCPHTVQVQEMQPVRAVCTPRCVLSPDFPKLNNTPAASQLLAKLPVNGPVRDNTTVVQYDDAFCVNPLRGCKVDSAAARARTIPFVV
jgi:hypothetical protein